MIDEWKKKMRRWCSLQDRCTTDVRKKLQAQFDDEAVVMDIVEALVEEGFLSDERFLTSYVRTHAEHKSWGPRKIAHGLRAKGFSSAEVNVALEAHSPASFQASLEVLVERRRLELPAKRERVIRFLVARGFAVNDILRALEEAGER
ncbi:MAG: hypothetical protein CL828_09015 [Crocinitomicaceae bacterium]|nr:hypothetical protein [Crocinitomicaceae bacterium]